jgi:hypothetical protein
MTRLHQGYGAAGDARMVRAGLALDDEGIRMTNVCVRVLDCSTL